MGFLPVILMGDNSCNDYKTLCSMGMNSFSCLVCLNHKTMSKKEVLLLEVLNVDELEVKFPWF